MTEKRKKSNLNGGAETERAHTVGGGETVNGPPASAPLQLPLRLGRPGGGPLTGAGGSGGQLILTAAAGGSLTEDLLLLRLRLHAFPPDLNPPKLELHPKEGLGQRRDGAPPRRGAETPEQPAGDPLAIR